MNESYSPGIITHMPGGSPFDNMSAIVVNDPQYSDSWDLESLSKGSRFPIAKAPHPYWGA